MSVFMACVIFCGQIVLAKDMYTADNVNFRNSPSLDASVHDVIPIGTRVNQTDILPGGWSAVSYNGVAGFMSSEYLCDKMPPVHLFTTATVNFRDGASLNANIREALPPGTRVLQTDILDGGWSIVWYNNEEGYMSNEFLSRTAPKREVVTLDSVRLRRSPDLDADVVEVITAGEIVVESERYSSGWSFVSYNGTNGYIFNEYLGSKETYKKNLSVGGIKASSTPKAEVARSDTNVKYQEISASGVELLDWGTAKGIFKIGADALVTDVWTGKQYYVRSFSNGNHADVEPVNKQDTDTMHATYGGSWDWDTRPIWVTVNGRTMAASINGMPHGGGVNSTNGMNGQICIHFRGSRTHNGNKSHENDHQASVTAAWNAANR